MYASVSVAGCFFVETMISDFHTSHSSFTERDIERKKISKQQS